jgi:3-oxoadipate enol-lactonase
MPVSERSIATSRGEMAWLEAGAGWPVILIHGFALSADIWRPQLGRVPSGWRFIAPDLRGCGRTPLGDVPVTMDAYARDVLALMDHLAIDSATIGGLSMGGYVVFAMHRLAALRFNGLVLAATRAQTDTPQGREGRLAMRRALALGGPPAVASEMLPKLLSPGAGEPAAAMVRQVIEANASPGIDAAIGAMLDRPDSTPDLARITSAALVVVGEHDAITPVADSEAMRVALRRATLTVIPKAGHLVNVEAPDAFSRALADFLVAI